MAREDVAFARPQQKHAESDRQVVPIPGMPTKFVSADVIPKRVSGIRRRVPTLRGVGTPPACRNRYQAGTLRRASDATKTACECHAGGAP